MPGSRGRPGKNIHGKTNATFFALLHGYVVVSAGARGREMEDVNKIISNGTSAGDF